MKRLTDYTSYADAQSHFASDRLWELFDGDRSVFNIAHECVDRHAGRGREAVIVCRADGVDEKISFDDLSRDSSQFAHYLERKGVQKGDRVAIMLEPSHEFYTAMFGVIKRGAIAVPLFTLFGPDGVRLRVGDCKPVLLVTNEEKREVAAGLGTTPYEVFSAALWQELAVLPSQYEIQSSPDELAVFQYTSGTTRELPEAVKC